MSKTITTKKGSVLPLMQLKGKDYLIVAHRLVWLVDDEESYTTDLEFPILKDDMCLAKVTLTLYDKDRQVVKRVQDCKMENKKDFPDFVEKAITGALGRCLAQVGKGTNYALQDLDEGTRIADAPLEAPPKEKPKPSTTVVQQETTTKAPETQTTTESPKKVATFRRPKVETTPATSDDGWE